MGELEKKFQSCFETKFIKIQQSLTHCKQLDIVNETFIFFFYNRQSYYKKFMSAWATVIVCCVRNFVTKENS